MSVLFATVAVVSGVLGVAGTGFLAPTAAVGVFGLSAMLFLVTLTAGLINADFEGEASGSRHAR